MKRKAIYILTTFVLVILPFLVVIAIGRYSPYVEGNSFLRYVTICSVISMAIVLAASTARLRGQPRRSANWKNRRRGCQIRC